MKSFSSKFNSPNPTGDQMNFSGIEEQDPLSFISLDQDNRVAKDPQLATEQNPAMMSLQPLSTVELINKTSTKSILVTPASTISTIDK